MGLGHRQVRAGRARFNRYASEAEGDVPRIGDETRVRRHTKAARQNPIFTPISNAVVLSLRITTVDPGHVVETGIPNRVIAVCGRDGTPGAYATGRRIEAFVVSIEGRCSTG